MRLLDRYLLRELLIPLGYCLSGFLLLWISSNLFVKLGDFQKRGLSTREIAEYYALTTPGDLVEVVLPIALLLALLYALTNHARHNEITAIRAAGVSLWRLSLPYLAVGFIASLVSLAVNELWAPAGEEAAEALLERHLPPSLRRAGRYEFPGFCFDNLRDGRRWVIGLYNSLTGEMTGVVVTWTAQDGSVPWQLNAEKAVPGNGGWTFYNVREYRAAAHSDLPPVPSLQTNVLPRPDFSETPAEINSQIKVNSIRTLGAVKELDVPIRELLNYLRLNPNPPAADWYWLYTKLHGRLAAPWTCLVVVLIALPFGIASGRRNVFVGVAASIFICLVYILLRQVGLTLGATGSCTPWMAAWFPNLVFGLAGIWLTARVR
jgi:lipopolysaccharide export system permease protein